MPELEQKEEILLEKFEEIIALLERMDEHLEKIERNTRRQVSPSG